MVFISVVTIPIIQWMKVSGIVSDGYSNIIFSIARLTVVNTATTGIVVFRQFRTDVTQNAP